MWQPKEPDRRSADAAPKDPRVDVDASTTQLEPSPDGNMNATPPPARSPRGQDLRAHPGGAIAATTGSSPCSPSQDPATHTRSTLRSPTRSCTPSVPSPHECVSKHAIPKCTAS
ncbi:hypothetical protein ElyMa_005603100 [Elysia marginata]|uniref:Uncharacterized protein n=1 Tax=Elysia marginata TaxID=1093978 RepID=A0AAV4F651_9GAST|nr:hypothetical protein ElyMa_005603100 [Elysia marginata]